MDQVARLYNLSAHLHRDVNLDQTHIGMRHQDCIGEELEPQGTRFVHIAHTTIGHDPKAAQGLVDIALHFTPEGPNGLRIDVLHDHHPWPWHGRNRAPPFLAGDA